MKRLLRQRRTLALLAVIAPLLALFIHVALRSGPLAPVAVTVTAVKEEAVAPALFGIGTVEARYIYRIGPTIAGRVKWLDVHVGDRVKAGQILGEMDAVDLDERMRAQDAVLKRAEAALREAEARQTHAQTQARRHERLYAARLTSEEVVTTKRQELEIADAALSAAREELIRARADRAALTAQRSHLVDLGKRCAALERQRVGDRGAVDCRECPDHPDVFFQEVRRPATSRTST